MGILLGKEGKHIWVAWSPHFSNVCFCPFVVKGFMPI